MNERSIKELYELCVQILAESPNSDDELTEEEIELLDECANITNIYNNYFR